MIHTPIKKTVYCSGKFHTMKGGGTCNGQKLAELNGMTMCEYYFNLTHSFNSYRSDITMPTDDGMPFFMSLHPRPPFFKRVWYAIKAIFVRPKFSAEAIEPAQEVIDTMMGMLYENTAMINNSKPLPVMDIKDFGARMRKEMDREAVDTLNNKSFTHEKHRKIQ